MKFAPFLAMVAMIALTSTMPADAAKENKLPRCTGKHLRPANPLRNCPPDHS